MVISDKLQGILATQPRKPGCYIYRNVEGTIIYVGKAINLKNRVRSTSTPIRDMMQDSLSLDANFGQCPQLPDHGLVATTRLARQVTAFSLTYSDIETATQWIQQTIAAE